LTPHRHILYQGHHKNSCCHFQDPRGQGFKDSSVILENNNNLQVW
jgi:hypothetical protein